MPQPLRAPVLVSVICCSNRPDHVERAFANYARQTYPERELVFVMHGDGFDRAAIEARAADLPRTRVLACPAAATLADCLNLALEHAGGDYFAKMDDDDFYAADYLADLMLAFEYADAAVVGKRTYYVHLGSRDLTALRFPGHEFSYVSFVHGGTIVAERRATAGIRFAPVRRGTDTLFLKACREEGLRIFSADRFNFAHLRQKDTSHHTWQIEEAEILATCSRTAPGFAPDLITV